MSQWGRGVLLGSTTQPIPRGGDPGYPNILGGPSTCAHNSNQILHDDQTTAGEGQFYTLDHALTSLANTFATRKPTRHQFAVANLLVFQ